MKKYYHLLTEILGKKFHFDAKYFIGGGIWLSLGQSVSLITGLAITALLAHFLTERDYGIYKYLLSLAVILGSFSLTGIGQSILQATARGFTGYYRQSLKFIFKYSLFITTLSLLAALYYFINDNNTLALGCLIIAITQPLIKPFQFINTYLQGLKNFKESTKIHTLKTIFTALSLLFSIFWTDNILIILSVYFLSQAIVNLFLFKYTNPSLAPLLKSTKRQFDNYAKHTSIRNIISTIATKADNIIVFTRLGASELAIYSIATIIPEQIKGTFKNLASLILPKYSASMDANAVKLSLPKRSVQLFLVFTLISIAYILVSPYVYDLLFPKYSKSIVYSQIFALSFPASIGILTTSYIQSQLNNGALYRIDIMMSIITLIVMYAGSYYGVMGVVVSRVILRYLNLALSFYYVYKK